MGNQALFRSGQNQDLEQFYHRFSVFQRDPVKNLLYMTEKKTGRELMLRQLTTNDEIQKSKIEMLVMEKRAARSKFLLRLQDHFFERERSYCSNQFKAYLLFESHYKDLKEEMLERRLKKNYFEDDELLSILESGCMGLKYLKQIGHPHEAVCSAHILINRQGVIMLSDPWIITENTTFLQNSHIYLSPEKIEAANSINSQNYDWYTSDLFSLGMVMLEVANLEFMDDVYQRGNRQISYLQLDSKMEAVKNPTIRKYVQGLLSNTRDRLSVVNQIQMNIRHGTRPKFSHQILKNSNSEILKHSNIRVPTAVAVEKPLESVCIPMTQTYFRPDSRVEMKHAHTTQPVYHTIPQRNVQIVSPVKMTSNILPHPKTKLPEHNTSMVVQKQQPVQEKPRRYTSHSLATLPSYYANKSQPATNSNQLSMFSKGMIGLPHKQMQPVGVQSGEANKIIQPTKQTVSTMFNRNIQSRKKVVQKNEPVAKQQKSDVRFNYNSPNPAPKMAPSAPQPVKFMKNKLEVPKPTQPFLNSMPYKQVEASNIVSRKYNESQIGNSAINGLGFSTPAYSQIYMNNVGINQAGGSTLTSQYPSFIKKVPAPSTVKTYEPIKEAVHIRSPQVVGTYKQKQTNINNAHAHSQNLVLSKLQQILNSDMNPSDAELFTKPELLKNNLGLNDKYSLKDTVSMPQTNKYYFQKNQRSEYTINQTPKVEVKYGSYSTAQDSYFDNKPNSNRTGLFEGVLSQTTPQYSKHQQPYTQKYRPYKSSNTPSLSEWSSGVGYSNYNSFIPSLPLGSVRSEAATIHSDRVKSTFEETKVNQLKLDNVYYSEQPKQIKTQRIQIKRDEQYHHPPITPTQPIKVESPVVAQFSIKTPLMEQQKKNQLIVELDKVVLEEKNTLAPQQPSFKDMQISEEHKTIEVTKSQDASSTQKYLLNYDDYEANKPSTSKSEKEIAQSNSANLNIMSLVQPSPPANIFQAPTTAEQSPQKHTPQQARDDASKQLSIIYEDINEQATPSRPAASSQAQEKRGSRELSVSSNQNSAVDDESEYVIEEYEVGSKYEGYKKNGMRNGKGKFYYQDGGYYEGEWKDNKMHGYGKLYYNESKIAYEGQWYMDQFHGKGKVYNDNPVHLDGPFNYKDFDQLEEYWVYYQGNLVTDTKEGMGKLKLSNGEIFEGEFRHDMIEGKGKFFTVSGEIIAGIWKESKLLALL